LQNGDRAFQILLLICIPYDQEGMDFAGVIDDSIGAIPEMRLRPFFLGVPRFGAEEIPMILSLQ
jgi:hypothetical protein